VIDSILKNIKKQRYFFLIYAVFLLFLVFILSNFSKTDATLWANQFWSPFQDMTYKYLTYLGDFGMASVVVITLLFWRFKYAVIAIVSFGVTAGITQFLKKIIFYDIKRPMYHDDLWKMYKHGEIHLVEGVKQMSDYSFPSGHTTSAFSILCLIALLSKNKWVGLVSIVFAILIGYSRVYLCQHFFEDVFVGALIGAIGSLLLFSLFEKKEFGNWGNKSLLKLR
jgi:membrane-associated phospholipid phosphatase